METAPVENPVDTVRKQLNEHIRECASNQRWIFRALIVILVYMASHDVKAFASAVGHAFAPAEAGEGEK